MQLSISVFGDPQWPDPEPPQVGVLIRQNRGANYPQAVDTARCDALYLERSQDKALFHFAAFSRSEQQASLASTLLGLLVGIKGTLIYDGAGAPIPREWDAKQVLDCYAKSGISKDFRAHCHTVKDDPFSCGTYFSGEAQDRYVLPCRLIERFKLRPFWEHPSRVVDLVLAAGVDSGCHWCPNFGAEASARLGTEA